MVDEAEIAGVVSRLTGIPATRLTEADRSRLAKLESELHERVIGQDPAVSAIAKAVRRSRTGMGDPNRPVGSFLFLGPTASARPSWRRPSPPACSATRPRCSAST